MRLRRFCSLALAFVVIFCALSSVSAYAAKIETWHCGSYVVPPIPEKTTSAGVPYGAYIFAWGTSGQLGLRFINVEKITLNENGRFYSGTINVYTLKDDSGTILTENYLSGSWRSTADMYQDGRVILWSSVDVYNADGTLYMAGSDPVITMVEIPDPPIILDTSDVLPVFSAVVSWFAGAIGSATSMFWTAEGGLTVLGILAVASLAIAAIILLIYLLAGWLKFK